MSSRLQAFASKSRDRVLKISGEAARSFLFQHGYNSSSYVLPEFFTPMGFNRMNLEPIDWSSRQGRSRYRVSSPIELVAPKGQHGWRRYSVLHPYAFWHIATSLTDDNAWPIVQESLARQTDVATYTIPSFSKPPGKKIQGNNISTWLRFAETDLIADAPSYSHLGTADIQNFYPSVYTHSLAWAVDGRDRIKANRSDFALVGNRIDYVFQRSHDGQTNGIPIGSMVSDVAAELLLISVDEALSVVLEDEVIVARYRDDYRVLARSYHAARQVLKDLGKSLHGEIDLHLNGEKTTVHDDILTGTLRPWVRAARESTLIQRVTEPTGHITGMALREALLALYCLQRDYPGGRVATSTLQRINSCLEAPGTSLKRLRLDEVRSCMAVLRMLMHLREEFAPHVMILADKLLDEFSDRVSKPLIIEMIEEEQRVAGNDFLEIWLYRLTMHRFPELSAKLLAKTNSPLLRMARLQRPAIEEFPSVAGLAADDMAELRKFKFVSEAKLRKTASAPLTSEIVELWSQQYM